MRPLERTVTTTSDLQQESRHLTSVIHITPSRSLQGMQAASTPDFSGFRFQAPTPDYSRESTPVLALAPREIPQKCPAHRKSILIVAKKQQGDGSARPPMHPRFSFSETRLPEFLTRPEPVRWGPSHDDLEDFFRRRETFERERERDREREEKAATPLRRLSTRIKTNFKRTFSFRKRVDSKAESVQGDGDEDQEHLVRTRSVGPDREKSWKRSVHKRANTVVGVVGKGWRRDREDVKRREGVREELSDCDDEDGVDEWGAWRGGGGETEGLLR